LNNKKAGDKMNDTASDSAKYILMTPGPVPLPPEVLEVLAKPMEHHRTPEFITLWNRVLANLKSVFVTEEPAFIHTSTGSGAMESALPMDDWGVDVMIGGSQKAFMLPTGLSFISFSKKAWTLVEAAKCPRYYFDIRREKTANVAGESFFSSAVTHIRALDLVLDIFLKQGLHRVHERIQALSHATIIAAREMGLSVFSEVPSPSITALLVPDGIDGQKVRADMEKHEAVIVMGGQDQLKGKIIRIGNMGAIRDQDLLATLKGLAACINRQKPNTIAESKIESALARATELLAKTPAVVLKS
jgi:aspartate aminotransferase-like enzyme